MLSGSVPLHATAITQPSHPSSKDIRPVFVLNMSLLNLVVHAFPKGDIYLHSQ